MHEQENEKIWDSWAQEMIDRGEENNPLNHRTATSQDAGLGTRGSLKQSKAPIRSSHMDENSKL